HEFNNTLFLVDFEFLGFDIVGLDIIENLGIQSRSILVTSHYEEMKLRIRCEHLGVQLIPKGMAGFVPITIEIKKKVDAILIDDDILVHLCWKMIAKEKQKVLALFTTSDDFMNEVASFTKDVPIYIDVSLANGIRGEEIAKKIFNMG